MKAEILAKKLSRGQDGLYETEWQDWYRVSKGTTFVNNVDWKLKFKLSPHQDRDLNLFLNVNLYFYCIFIQKGTSKTLNDISKISSEVCQLKTQSL